MNLSFRQVLVALCFTVGACEAPEELPDETADTLRSASTGPKAPTGIGIIASNPFKAMSTCMNFCDTVECSEPCQEPEATLESLGDDKWLCSCECVCTEENCPLEFIHACDPSLYLLDDD